MSVDTEVIDKFIFMVSLIVELDSALRKFGAHSYDCRVWMGTEEKCTCGLERALGMKSQIGAKP